MNQPLIEVKDVCRDYTSGAETVRILKNINLTIHAGEMVAIVGSSGSGKSTLMNILGCLDRPTSGSYCIAGRETLSLSADELARLRREYFGFIFQRYHLLPGLSALANTEVPAVYAGTPRLKRRQLAEELLYRLDLGERMMHRPSQLSGGQQQRVSIARALINGGSIILADEPTGALDSFHGKEVMNLLAELNAEGHTVVIVTHDLQVAAYAHRFIAIHDGEIIEDRRTGSGPTEQTGDAAEATPQAATVLPKTDAAPQETWRTHWERFVEASKMALLSMKAHRLRTMLTMLGIIIGIASVVSVTALGEGSRQRVLRELSELGTSTLEIYPGKEIGQASLSGPIRLTPADVDVLAREPYADSVSPSVNAGTQVRYRNLVNSAQIYGVGEQFFRVKGMQFDEGRPFTRESIKQFAQEVVIDQSTRNKLFGQDGPALGEVLLLNNVPVRVIGVTKDNKGLMSGPDSLNVWMPYSSVQARLGGSSSLQSIIVRLHDKASNSTEADIKALLQQRHQGRDLYISNNANLRQTVEGANNTLTLLITSIALISLLVGGIGVMNIMLVSVSERTKEIGVRMAVGARQSNIMQQFLIESVLVCLLGGVLGIVLSLGVGIFFNHTNSEFSMVFSANSIIAAFATCTLVGMVFGFVPARNAARLNPVDALVRES